jgi:hypothetical protein
VAAARADQQHRWVMRDDEQAKAGAAALLVSAATMLCALAAAGVQRDGLSGCST